MNLVLRFRAKTLWEELVPHRHRYLSRNPHTTSDGPALGVNALIRRALRTIFRNRSW